VDHIAYTITNWDAEEDGLEEELKRRNLQYTGSVKTSFQVKDPEGMGVQFGGLPELTRRPSKVSANAERLYYGYPRDKALLHDPLDPLLATLNPDYRRFTAGRSMRDVEHAAILKITDPYGQLLI
jgi:hypothetical protein